MLGDRGHLAAETDAQLNLHGGYGIAALPPHDLNAQRENEFPEAFAGLSVVREDLLVEWNGRRVNPILAAAASDGQRTLV